MGRDQPISAGPIQWLDPVTRRDRHRLRWPTSPGWPPRSVGVAAGAGGAAVALICWYFGAGAWPAATFGCVAGAIGLFYPALPDLGETHWRPVEPTRTGARHDLSSLAASLRPQYGRVGERAVQALRDLAGPRLTRYHLDLAQPDDRREIQRLIGRRACTVVQPGRQRRPTYRSVLHCLDALDGLDPAEERHAR